MKMKKSAKRFIACIMLLVAHAIMIGLADIVDNTYKIANNRAGVE